MVGMTYEKTFRRSDCERYNSNYSGN